MQIYLSLRDVVSHTIMQSSVLTDGYQRFISTEDITGSSSILITDVQIDEEKKFSSIRYTPTLERIIVLPISIPRPVYVVKEESTGEDKEIIYNAPMMEFGKLYEINFKGERWALRKTEKEVEFLKFYPDKK
jgi:hypothetical protein